ncbi:hypothetical protein GS601_10195 [Myxacorys almedinensis A]|uniref:Uncharacterized protein n=2 Tax=Myxacorys TaxID=2056239 RepID=A0A8J7YZZ8_9CYAN|nr:hypothetical protein [Myxacorys almedinensis A]
MSATLAVVTPQPKVNPNILGTVVLNCSDKPCSDKPAIAAVEIPTCIQSAIAA